MSLTKHLQERGIINPAEEYGVWIDEDSSIATFPIYEQSGRMIGYQQYNPFGYKTKRNNPKEGKYFTYYTKGEYFPWGVHSLYRKSSPLFLVEGIFDAIPLHNAGLKALALLTQTPKKENFKSWLRTWNGPVYYLRDGDGQASKTWLSNVVTQTIWCPEEKDPGDLTVNELTDILESYHVKRS